MNGLIKSVKYSFDKDFFKVGDCYRIHKLSETNVYRNCILVEMTDTTLKFLGNGIQIEINISELYWSSSYEINKLVVDYSEKGTFSADE